jgi:hypothetical protein
MATAVHSSLVSRLDIWMAINYPGFKYDTFHDAA